MQSHAVEDENDEEENENKEEKVDDMEHDFLDDYGYEETFQPKRALNIGSVIRSPTRQAHSSGEGSSSQSHVSGKGKALIEGNPT
ncbi:hypothetical protein J1N35_037175 [Gossypium stocksii]|uniref:Uncharacterized protein n=1 Tax=Gossypium stocksii TaxID=47602 RepID=A0A9D3UJN9_9ROSI|nr:hypothetical protein J1N35_037175 [Gossypium stocksii]